MSAEVAFANHDDQFMIHLKYCDIKEFLPTISGGWYQSDQFYFLIDGCLLDIPFVSKNFGKLKYSTLTPSGFWN